MALPPLASVSDLADWLGEAITEDADETRAGGVLRMASALVRRETGRTWVEPDTDPPVLVDLPDPVELVTLACAARGYTNPRAIEDVSEGVDDYNHRERTRVEESGLYLTASERDLLSEYAGTANQGLATVATTRGECANPDLLYREEERLLPPWY